MTIAFPRIPFPIADLAARSLTGLDAEKAHQTTIAMLARGLGPVARENPDPRLEQRVASMHFPNPLGLAAGFDKNAQAMTGSYGLGFGFVEVGAVTPKPQAGNDKPRVFRLRDDQAVINRYGFNNDGLDTITARIAAYQKTRNPVHGPLGINLGANKDAEDRVEDFVTGLTMLADHVDFCTVNISSPNTPGLRTLQDKSSLMELLARVMAARDAAHSSPAVFLKVAPDLTDEDVTDIACAVQSLGIDGLIVSNTTLARAPSLRSEHASQAGGLSGKPLFEASTRKLSEFYQALGPEIPLIGVGGISSPRDAYTKIQAGARLVQLYTGLIYQGPSLVRTIVKSLPDFLEADGFATLRQAVGSNPF